VFDKLGAKVRINNGKDHTMIAVFCKPAHLLKRRTQLNRSEEKRKMPEYLVVRAFLFNFADE
jgi:hypothetical protein